MPETSGYVVPDGFTERIVEKIHAWVPFTIEGMVDAGLWDDLTPEQQKDYLARQAIRDAYRTSFAGRWAAFGSALWRLRQSIGFAIAGYTPSEDDY